MGLNLMLKQRHERKISSLSMSEVLTKSTFNQEKDSFSI